MTSKEVKADQPIKKLLDQFDPGVQKALVYSVALVLICTIIGLTSCFVNMDRESTKRDAEWTKRVEAIHGKKSK